MAADFFRNAYGLMQNDQLQNEFVRLIHECERDLHAYILSLVPDRNDMLDILQETTLELWAKFDQYDRRRSFGAWARSFAHIMVARYRAERRRQSKFSGWLTEETLYRLADEYDRQEGVLLVERDALDDCVRKLNTGDLALLRQRYWEQVSVRELATSLGKTESSLYTRLHRIRTGLLHCVEQTLAREGLQ